MIKQKHVSMAGSPDTIIQKVVDNIKSKKPCMSHNEVDYIGYILRPLIEGKDTEGEESEDARCRASDEEVEDTEVDTRPTKKPNKKK